MPKGSYPELIARGTQGKMQIYQLHSLIDIERYQRINVLARRPQEVAAPEAQLRVANNLGFLQQCIKRFALIEFIDRQTERCFLAIRGGSFDVCERRPVRSRIWRRLPARNTAATGA